jgi:hypothetical protein
VGTTRLGPLTTASAGKGLVLFFGCFLFLSMLFLQHLFFAFTIIVIKTKQVGQGPGGEFLLIISVDRVFRQWFLRGSGTRMNF